MTPIFYSFRRCPYAMRARLALIAADQRVELREVLLRDKAPEFLAISPSATVPCLKVGDTVLDESLEIMKWALARNDPDGWLTMPDAGHALIEEADGPFKDALDRTKYANRYPGTDAQAQRAIAYEFLRKLDALVADKPWLFGDHPSLADMAILPFVRQFANIDRPLFDAQPWPNLIRWLDTFLASDIFTRIMPKFPVWKSGDAPTQFP